MTVEKTSETSEAGSLKLDPAPRFFSLDCPDGEIARLVLNGTPDLVAALDGLAFWARDELLIMIIRAALGKVCEEISAAARNPEMEDGELATELEAAAARLQLGAREFGRLIELRDEPAAGPISPPDRHP